ncbi:MAG: hypothetical protein H6726_25905 [Sandaracinaceae bacterium]|nr:hypothetical protein [Myxococcales bacterium]MCB9661109.1 hypothetical protein [Sandaracinaceae bacterium]
MRDARDSDGCSRWVRWRALGLAAVVASFGWGCGRSTRAGGQGVRAPLTDQDPEPYRPTPHAAGDEDLRALAASSHVDSAVQLALEFLEAVRDANLTRARALMADEMYRLGERDTYRPMSANNALVQLRSATSRGRAAGVRLPPIARLVQLQHVEVTAPRPTSADIQQRLRPNDTLVTFPSTAEGRVELARWYPGWTARVRVLVRVGGSPQVIGF